MSNNKRNVRYFPKMKVRGKRNRRRESFDRMTGGFDRLVVESGRAARSMAELFKAIS